MALLLIKPEQADDYVNITGVMVAAECSGCGASIVKYPAQVRNNRRRGVDRLYCSRSCLDRHRLWEPPRGEDHPQWKGGSDYRRRALEAHGAYCHECGYDKELTLLWVHHKDFTRTNHDLDNLAVLCIRCHLELHLERDRAVQK